MAKEEAVARDWSRSLFQSAEAGSTVRSPFTVTSVAQTHLTPVTTAAATAVAVVEVVVVLETAGLLLFDFVVVFACEAGWGWGVVETSSWTGLWWWSLSYWSAGEGKGL